VVELVELTGELDESVAGWLAGWLRASLEHAVMMDIN